MAFNTKLCEQEKNKYTALRVLILRFEISEFRNKKRTIKNYIIFKFCLILKIEPGQDQ